jgi:hypothetical protein
LLAGQEHGRTIPLADTIRCDSVDQLMQSAWRLMLRRFLARWGRQCSDLMEQRKTVRHAPVFDKFAASEAADVNDVRDLCPNLRWSSVSRRRIASNQIVYNLTTLVQSTL